MLSDYVNFSEFWTYYKLSKTSGVRCPPSRELTVNPLLRFYSNVTEATVSQEVDPTCMLKNQLVPADETLVCDHSIWAVCLGMRQMNGII